MQQSEISNGPLAQAFIRVGKEGIETGDDAVLDVYFADDFVFHGPGGDMTLVQLKSLWDAYRTALTGFTITREQIVVEGRMAAGRNTFTGVFERPFTQSPVGTIQPTGERVTWEVINTFRYDEEGKLAEEWVQMDTLNFLKQFGVDLI